MSLSLDGWGMIWRRQLRSRFAINPNNPQIIFFWLVRGHAKYGGSPLLALTFQTLPSRLETYWIGGHHFGSLSRQQVSPVDSVFATACWWIWKERNSRIFTGLQSSATDVVAAIKATIHSWIATCASKLAFFITRYFADNPPDPPWPSFPFVILWSAVFWWC